MRRCAISSSTCIACSTLPTIDPRAALTLQVAANGVTLSIADNGRGFDVAHALADPRAGLGLRNMRERLESLGGRLDIASQPGHTLVTAWVPVAPSPREAPKAAAGSGTSTS